MTKTFEIEAKDLTKAQSTKLNDILNQLVFNTERSIDVDLKRLGMVIPTLFTDLYLKVGRGGNHIWISKVKNNERIAVIFFNEN